MSKDTYYFPHDFYAREDPKLQRVLMKHKLSGIGAYWCIVENLYEQGGVCRKCDIEAIAFGLHCDTELIESVLNDFGLFERNADGDYVSPSVNKRLEHRRLVAQKRSNAGRKGNAVRWQQTSNANANDNIANASEESRKTSQGKERKGKEKEIKEDKSSSISKESIKKFVKPTVEEVAEYIREKGYNVDAEQFVNFYESKGWKVGTTPMKSWTAAVATWQKRNSNGNGNSFNGKSDRACSEGYVQDYTKTSF